MRILHVTVDCQKKLQSQFGPNFFVCCRFHFIFGDCSGGVCSVLWHVFYLLEVFCSRCRSIWVYATPKKCHSICMCQKMNSRVKNLQTRLFDDMFQAHGKLCTSSNNFFRTPVLAALCVCSSICGNEAIGLLFLNTVAVP